MRVLVHEFTASYPLPILIREEEITTYAETQGDWVETKLDGWDKGEGWRCTDRYYGE